MDKINLTFSVAVYTLVVPTNGDNYDKLEVLALLFGWTLLFLRSIVVNWFRFKKKKKKTWPNFLIFSKISQIIILSINYVDSF